MGIEDPDFAPTFHNRFGGDPYTHSEYEKKKNEEVAKKELEEWNAKYKFKKGIGWVLRKG